MENYTLDLDKPRKLKYGFKAVRLIREKFQGKKDLTDFMDVNLDEIVYFVWVGLIWEDENLTVEQVEKLLDDAIPDKYKMVEIVKFVGNVIVDQIGATPEKKEARGEISLESTENQPSESASETKKNSSV
jgi:hypothetical protein